MGFFSSIKRLGQKAWGATKRIGQKALNVAQKVGHKVVEYSGDVADVAGLLAKGGAMLTPLVAGIPGVNLAVAGATAGLAGLSAGAESIYKFSNRASKRIDKGKRMIEGKSRGGLERGVKEIGGIKQDIMGAGKELRNLRKR